jgi:hypothetical protein
MGEVPKKLATGIGFTVIVIVMGVPEQPLAAGITV